MLTISRSSSTTRTVAFLSSLAIAFRRDVISVCYQRQSYNKACTCSRPIPGQTCEGGQRLAGANHHEGTPRSSLYLHCHEPRAIGVPKRSIRRFIKINSLEPIGRGETPRLLRRFTTASLPGNETFREFCSAHCLRKSPQLKLLIERGKYCLGGETNGPTQADGRFYGSVARNLRCTTFFE